MLQLIILTLLPIIMIINYILGDPEIVSFYVQEGKVLNINLGTYLKIKYYKMKMFNN